MANSFSLFLCDISKPAVIQGECLNFLGLGFTLISGKIYQLLFLKEIIKWIFCIFLSNNICPRYWFQQCTKWRNRFLVNLSKCLFGKIYFTLFGFFYRKYWKMIGQRVDKYSWYNLITYIITPDMINQSSWPVLALLLKAQTI